MPENVWWSDDPVYLAERVYPNLTLQVQGDGSRLSRRAILAPNDDIREINLQIPDMWPGDPIDLFSADSLFNAEDKYACSVEFLQNTKPVCTFSERLARAKERAKELNKSRVRRPEPISLMEFLLKQKFNETGTTVSKLSKLYCNV